MKIHFESAVERIAAFRPDVLLVEASVDRIAIRMLEVCPDRLLHPKPLGV
jgi:hypothetical protein